MENTEFNLTLSVDRKLISKSEPSERFLEAVVQAPSAAVRKERIPLNIALVLDRSGSMGGGKLEAAKQAAVHALDMLEAQDRVSVVVYDDQVKILAENTLVSDEQRNRIKDLIRPVRTGGSTALHEGWLTGCREVARFKSEGALNRCLLLTDGLANVGLTDPEQLAVQSRDLYDQMIATSTIGVGEGFDEHLLEAMANAGGGSFYSIESSGDIPRIFEQEFSELAEITAQDVEIDLEFNPAVTLEVYGGWRIDFPSPGHARLHLGSIGSGKMRTVYARLVFPPAGDQEPAACLQAVARAKGSNAGLLESACQVAWQHADHAEASAETPDAGFMRRFAEVRIAHDANAALKLERMGRIAEAGMMMNSSLAAAAPNLSDESSSYYIQLKNEIEQGLDEQHRKMHHRRSYSSRQGRGVEDKPTSGNGSSS